MMKRLTYYVLICTAVIAVAASCSKLDDGFLSGGGKHRRYDDGNYSNGTRTEINEPRRITLLYSLGVTDLRAALLEDIGDLSSSWLPGCNRQENMLLVFSHSGTAANYTVPSKPVLFRIYRDYDGKTARDTIKSWPEDRIGTSAEMLTEVLTFVRDNFSSASCGVVFSSHGSGWLPRNYYNNSSMFDYGELARRNTVRKSFGEHKIPGKLSKEINIDELAAAIPYRLDYIIFDSCLMGGVEVAYELKDACRLLVASPTEILADGLDYVNIPRRLLSGENADVLGVCEDYMEHYLAKNSSATISCIDCTKLDGLAAVCKDIFSKYSKTLETLPDTGIQRYYRNSYHWFYDLRSMLSKLPVTKEELTRFDEALDKAVIYNKATEKFISITIKEHCGLSTYLQSRGSDYLDRYYRTLKWNKATGYVAEE